MKQTPEPETCTSKMLKEGARIDPKWNQEGPTISTAGDLTEASGILRKEQKVTAPEEGNQKAMDQTKIQDRITESNDSKLTMQQERKTERSLLFMIAAGVVCQTTSHSWYG